ncbi:cytochrome (ubi)quinol oxidase subunit III [Chengkuizengella marina]|uniref:Cytochrome (Ubi)quinol oxidase subunit III n=1 Tax=Chengkuizengella marina TaxID=2507566 RepID=A0A6N9Q608_9BACL|nr:cytochrome (ubi)quinol oxidase subunit III [Chengkuizengella marina]NBI30054.1 cytochrome (ubi)quinol oxidase subunit III [Chengkuizengella marina]
MSHAEAHLDKLPPEPEKATLEGRNKVLGFWLFLGGETVLFGTLFATFLALRGSVLDGPTGTELFDLKLVAAATFILLTSSLTSVFAVQAMHHKNVKNLMIWLGVTVLLGFGFLVLEIYEFYHYVHEGHGFTTSAFSSSFYALVGFHGAHVALGVLWIGLLIIQLKVKGLNTTTAPKVYVASLYWHFIDVVWVFIFTIVYLMGKVG